MKRRSENPVITHITTVGISGIANRIMLVEVMHEAGLYPYRREWWHYEEIISITATRSKYKLLDF
jgi:D-alanyl-D-alanine dipeptidase